MAELIATASDGRVTLRTRCGTLAVLVLERAGGTVAATGPGTFTVSGLPAEQVVELLSGSGAVR